VPSLGEASTLVIWMTIMVESLIAFHAISRGEVKNVDVDFYMCNVKSPYLARKTNDG
jgi:hypothetical protein